MTHITRKILPGYIVIILLEKILKGDKIPECETQREGNLTYTECENKTFLSLENAFQSGIHGLKLVNCTIEVLNEFSLSKYKNLRKIIIIQTEIQQQTDNKLFEPLKQLQELILHTTYIQGLDSIQWPSNITYLNLTRCKLRNFKITTDTPHLRRIVLDENELKTFPNITFTAPLEEIYLDYNLGIVISVENLIPFCWLRVFQANEFERFVGFFRKNYCRCARTIKWLDEHSVRHNLGECYSTDCNIHYTGKLLEHYYFCKKKIPTLTAQLSIVIGGSFIILLAFLSTAFIIMKGVQMSKRTSIHIEEQVIHEKGKRERRHGKKKMKH